MSRMEITPRNAEHCDTSSGDDEGGIKGYRTPEQRYFTDTGGNAFSPWATKQGRSLGLEPIAIPTVMAFQFVAMNDTFSPCTRPGLTPGIWDLLQKRSARRFREHARLLETVFHNVCDLPQLTPVPINVHDHNTLIYIAKRNNMGWPRRNREWFRPSKDEPRIVGKGFAMKWPEGLEYE